jgi:rod shape-determining protein MreC
MQHHQTPAFFVRGPSPFARLVFFAALSLSLMATDARLHYLVEIRQGFMALLHPLQLVANAPSNLYATAQEYLVTQKTLLKHNRQLVQQSLEQSATLQRFKSLEAENENLHNLLGATQSITQPARLGEILHMGRDPFGHKVVVNLGARQNIVAGQAVVDAAGVIGQVTRVYPFSSEVTLITDKELAIPVQIERNGLRAIAFGHGRDTTVDLPYLPANVDIRKGDKLVTSGIDGVYPAGLAVAEVVLIERNPDSPFAHIVCKPIAGIENNRQVLLISIPKTEAPAATVINAPAAKNKMAAEPDNPVSAAKPHAGP